MLALTVLAVVVIGLVALVVAGMARERRNEQEVACEAVVTDAIHRELGAVVAPIVRKPLWGPWRLFLVLPLEQPDLVATVLRVARRALAPMPPSRFVIVVTPRTGAR